MLPRIDLRGRLEDARTLLPRAAVDVAFAVEAVRPTLDAIRLDGDVAVRIATAQFDEIELDELRVPVEEIEAATHNLDAIQPGLRAALEECIRRVRLVHEAQRRPDEKVTVSPGGTVTERWLPVDRVGLYVPGGLIAYPSSVVMNVVPAQVAGVRSIAIASPPQKEHGGRPHPAVLGAAGLLGITEVYSVGGAQAIGMFAYGTQSCPPVDVVTGPGNVYVAAAKRVVRGIVGIDAEAGPTEIGILADATADPAFLAADLIAQAEHDPLAACLLVSADDDLLEGVRAELIDQVAGTRHLDRVRAALAGQSATVLVDDLDAGIAVLDGWAPEHLEVITADARAVAERFRNAGAIFIGPYAPVSLGDYLAGSNHVLPTGGTARHSAGLSIGSFLRCVHLVEYSKEALAEVAPHLQALGNAEDLLAHVEAVLVRLR